MQLALKLLFLTAVINRHTKAVQEIVINAIGPVTTACECVFFLHCENEKKVINNLINIRSGTLTNIRNSPSQRASNTVCDNILKVCCELSNLKLPQKNRASSQFGRSCGVRNFDGISFKIMSQNKKNEAEFGEFPWMAIVLLYAPDELDLYVCGGTLIHRRVVLTAAHCIYGKNAAEIKIRVGDWDTQSIDEIITHQDRAIEAIIIHESYHSKSLENDFALLILSNPVSIMENVDIICLPEARYDFDVTGCFVSGWGKNKFGTGGRYQYILKKIELSFINPRACEQILRRTILGTNFELDRSFVCAGGAKGEDSCEGDGGSPLICPLKADPKRYVQVGIVSWGIGCGSDVPGVYANVLHARSWIDKQLLLHNFDNTVYQHRRYT
ncbi:serine protease homolog 90 isoform X1 [Nasonia vitripennis]|uniref:Phenoloxidase-activating factor 2 n=1 Tax=Nasonia vitripennis TaxID=7425 RepID=A0A7M7IKR0_NASVI|nr:serine protease homolog 90 precursor [Nasonia vitripennis]XP_008211083.1 serine protease homolog 90 isoform X1 [Nasonia vitripennis]XP_008211084.1 serine protease homolog 90 isoform X1 [Nasonia vitripennis]XP_016837000.1 serine protease homolog 90 isoform X1 [Nasonia vitripennis]XP_016837001.1 serine protease homolog 90 isoform X1 [Nasonia vitripennis]XP_031781188.1 serine protease homolog 90 isoform X1 [Nasonia vitripennis]